MSAKWIRAKRWDDEHLPRAGLPVRVVREAIGTPGTVAFVGLLGVLYAIGAWLRYRAGDLTLAGIVAGAALLALGLAFPIKFLLRAFSSVSLAIVLLVGVAIYCTLASVPVGLLALIPTYGVYALALLATLGVVSALPTYALVRGARRVGIPRPARFAMGLIVGVLLVGVAWFLWTRFAWPRLQWHPAPSDPTRGEGFRLFAGFAEAYKATTVRRLPALEMAEQEFYAWWPFRLLLLAFVANMVVATFRRIEFVFPNLGVLTVHTGIVVIALGSIYYGSAKREGDTVLMAGPPTPEGQPTPGDRVNGFYDRLQPALWFGTGVAMRQLPLPALPRYNDYDLAAVGGTWIDRLGRVRRVGEADAEADGSEPFLPALDLGVSGEVRTVAGRENVFVDGDISVRVVGYASYAEPEEIGVPIAPDDPRWAFSTRRTIDLIAVRPEGDAHAGEAERIGEFDLDSAAPAGRMGEALDGLLTFELTRDMAQQRWDDLRTVLGSPDDHHLIVEVPAEANAGLSEDFRGVYAIRPGMQIEVGPTGWSLQVEEILERPRLPIITEGYRGAQSSLAKVRVLPPSSVEPAFTRWVYHRFPEIAQDLLESLTPDGRPVRRDPDPRIRLSYLDASKFNVYLDLVTGADGSTSRRALVRYPGSREVLEPAVLDPLPEGAPIPLLPGTLFLEEGGRRATVDVPRVVPASERNRDKIGNHGSAMIALEVSVDPASPSPAAGWSQVRWLPFSAYAHLDVMRASRTFAIPDGRAMTFLFGRRWHALPGLGLRLTDFEMKAYKHTDVERDFVSTLEVVRERPRDEAQIIEASTSMNHPLSVRAGVSNAPSRGPLGALLAMIAPDRYKFSQNGWDATQWDETKKAADRGEIPRPLVRFTILGVGNNPGIRVIALGAVMMSLGIPWAFYVKPLIMRRRKHKIQERLRAEAQAPGRTPGQEVRP